MLYTRKGDQGDTSLFGCNQQRISKSSAVAEALGSLDEINSLLGLIKVKAETEELIIETLNEPASLMIGEIQQNLFIVQTELAGVDKHLTSEKVSRLEQIIDAIEKEMPPIKTFFVSGGTELAALFDFARTVARRAERRVVQVADEEARPLGEFTKPYLNRLSSVLYAFARYANFTEGVKEDTPTYE